VIDACPGEDEVFSSLLTSIESRFSGCVSP